MFVSKERLWEGEKVEGKKHFPLFGIRESNKGKKETHGPHRKKFSEKWTNFWAKKTITPLSYYYV
jgi:hypothetical protein